MSMKLYFVDTVKWKVVEIKPLVYSNAPFQVMGKVMFLNDAGEIHFASQDQVFEYEDEANERLEALYQAKL